MTSPQKAQYQRDFRRWLRHAVIAAALAIGGGVLIAAPASAAPAPTSADTPRLTFGVQPATRAGFDSSRADFSYSATPGALVNDYLAVRNYADAQVTLQTYAGDAFNGPTGGYDVLKRGQKSKDLGAWIKLDRSSVTVPGRGFVIIPFHVRMPFSALPGDHDAGIVAAIITQQLRSGGNRVTVEDRVGARVHVRVSGPLRPQLSVRSLKTVFHNSLNPFGSGSATVSYQVVNTGNVRLSAAQRLQVKSMIGGSGVVPKLPRLPELLPGNSFQQQAKVTGVWPGIKVKSTVTLDPAASPRFPVPGIKQVRKSASTWAIPWMLLAVLAALALIVAAAWWLRRRKAAAKRAAKPAVPEKELVGAGVGAAADTPREPPIWEPIDLRDPEPAAVDVRDSEPHPVDIRDPKDRDVIDLRPEEAAEIDTEGENPPPDGPNRK
jgi:hypothetical protein